MKKINQYRELYLTFSSIEARGYKGIFFLILFGFIILSWLYGDLKTSGIIVGLGFVAVWVDQIFENYLSYRSALYNPLTDDELTKPLYRGKKAQMTAIISIIFMSLLFGGLGLLILARSLALE